MLGPTLSALIDLLCFKFFIYDTNSNFSVGPQNMQYFATLLQCDLKESFFILPVSSASTYFVPVVGKYCLSTLYISYGLVKII
jgi:hypothetical protein